MYKYGMRLRGFSIGAQPSGVIKRCSPFREDETTGKYWDIIYYEDKLSDEDVRHYSLDYLGKED